MLAFNERGVLDTDALMRQAAAAFDTLQPQTRSKGSTVLVAQSRFVVSGGRWKPTPALEAEIRAVALGKQKCPVLKILPASSWDRLVKTACDTFSQLVFPITASTSGLGRLIQAKFDGMVDAQKVLAADVVRSAKEKLERTGRSSKGRPKAIVLVKAIETASNETDDNVREIWANLIANEILDNQVHPEFPRILERMSSNDAITLAEIAESSRKDSVKKATRVFAYGLEIMGIRFSALVEEATNFSREHLRNLNLIEKNSGQWRLTLTGEEFLKAVADPTFEYAKAEQGAARGRGTAGAGPRR